MKSNSIFFLILSLIYLLQELILYIRFLKKYGLKLRSGNGTEKHAWQYWYTVTIYWVSLYYLVIWIYALFDFDFWGLVSPVHVLNHPLFHTAGFVLGLMFLAGIAICRLHLGPAWRVGIDVNSSAELVSGGIYRFIRHPYFTALMGFEFSIFLILPNAVTLLAFLQSLIAIRYQAALEEHFLKGRHREAYTVYMEVTGRFLPKFRASG